MTLKEKKQQEPRPAAATPSTPLASAQTSTADECSAQMQVPGEASSATASDLKVKPFSNLLSHPVTAVYPLLEGTEFDAFREDIRLNGLRVPIWIYQGQIIDGRNRYRACQELGIEPRFQEWDGKGSLVGFAVSLNEKRRHLNDSQRALAAAKAKGLFEEEAWQRMLAGGAASDPPLDAEEGGKGESAAKAAELFHVGRDSVYKAQNVLEHGAPELQTAVEEGKVSISAAAALAELPPEEQTKAVAAGPKTVVAKAKEIRSSKKTHRNRQPCEAVVSSMANADNDSTPAEPTIAAAEILTLPAEPIAFAQTLVQKLGREAAIEYFEALERILWLSNQSKRFTHKNR